MFVLRIWADGSRQGKEEGLLWCHVQLVCWNELGSDSALSGTECGGMKIDKTLRGQALTVCGMQQATELETSPKPKG